MYDDLIAFETIQTAAPSLTWEEAGTLHAALLSEVRRVAPCLLDPGLDPGLKAEATYIITQALKRPALWIESEASGIYQAKYRAVIAGTGTVLVAADAASLRTLCGAKTPTPGMPRASFPEPFGIEDLYRRRP